MLPHTSSRPSVKCSFTPSDFVLDGVGPASRPSLYFACLPLDSFAFVFGTRDCLSPLASRSSEREYFIGNGCVIAPLRFIEDNFQASDGRRRRHQVCSGVHLNIYEISLLMGDGADICMPAGRPWEERTKGGRRN